LSEFGLTLSWRVVRSRDRRRGAPRSRDFSQGRAVNRACAGNTMVPGGVSRDPLCEVSAGASVASSPLGRPHRRQLLYGFITEGVNLHHVIATPPGHPEPLGVGLI
jgi:hypothetical protein